MEYGVMKVPNPDGELPGRIELVIPTWVRGRWPDKPKDWKTVDRALRAIAHCKSGLDAHEAYWLREMEAVKLWKQFGMVSALDYLERVVGYTPRVAKERLRVAQALGQLPQITQALADGKLLYSAVREVTRVAQANTEEEWLAAIMGKSQREVEKLVSGHRPGDKPEDPPRPDMRRHKLELDLAPEAFALLRQAHQLMSEECNEYLDDDQLIIALCRAVIDHAPANDTTGRAKYQIALTLCPRCNAGSQEGAGVSVDVDPWVVKQASCDAQHVGSVDGDVPERAHQDVSPSVRRLVWRRDHGRCRVPGCRSSRGLEVHHIIHREDGGSHEPSNLLLLCFSCHASHHRGRIQISGSAENCSVWRPAWNPPLRDPDYQPNHDASSAISASLQDRAARESRGAPYPRGS